MWRILDLCVGLPGQTKSDKSEWGIKEFEANCRRNWTCGTRTVTAICLSDVLSEIRKKKLQALAHQLANYLAGQNVELMVYRLYSPDLSLFDFSFEHFKKKLRGQAALEEAVNVFIN